MRRNRTIKYWYMVVIVCKPHIAQKERQSTMLLLWGKILLPVVIGIVIYKLDKRKNNVENAKSNIKQEAAAYIIGDLHGDYICAKYWVNKTGLVLGLSNDEDEDDMSSWSWADNSSKLVFMGDYIDKGPTSKQTVEFVKKLTDRFPEYVTALLGNHELQLLKDRHEYQKYGSAYFQYPYAVVHPLEYLNFVDAENDDFSLDDDKLVVDALYNASLEVYAYNAYSKVQFSPNSDPKHFSIVQLIPQEELRNKAQTRLAVYQDSYINAFASNTSLGQWLQTRPVLHMTHNTLLMHGGLTPKLAKFLSSNNNITHNILSINNLFQSNSAFHENDDESHTLNYFLENTFHGQLIEEFIWYRGNFKKDGCDMLQSHIQNNPSEEFFSRIAVGHTPDMNIRQLCNNTLLAVDSSLSRWFRVMGNNYCRGDKIQISSNGQFECPKINHHCEGEIIKIMNDEIHIISA